MNELQLFNFESLPVRKLEVEGKPYFVGKDVAEILGYTNPRDAINRHTKTRGVVNHDVIDSLGRTQSKKFIDEGNLYRLIAKSKLPQAEAFEEWVFAEVLPTLRKTGTYQSKPMTNAEKIKYIAQGTEELDERVTAIEKTYPIMPGEARHIQTLVKRKVAEVVRNKFNGYYQEVSKKLFSEIYKSIKKIFEVPTYTSIPRDRYREAIQFIEEWQPSYDTTYQLEMSLK